jgi:membrane associated rhomboid family serine protease
MHGGLPFIGLSTVVYGVVGLATITGDVIRKWRRK